MTWRQSEKNIRKYKAVAHNAITAFIVDNQRRQQMFGVQQDNII